MQKLFLSKVHAQCTTMHHCPPAHLLPYQDTLTAVVVMPLVREVACHITQWKFEFLKFKTKLLIQVLRTTSAHLQHKNSTLLLSAQLWQCRPAQRDLKGCCSQSSPFSNKIKGTQQKKQSTPFSRGTALGFSSITCQRTLLLQNFSLLWYSKSIKLWVMYNHHARRAHLTRDRWTLLQCLCTWAGQSKTYCKNNLPTKMTPTEFQETQLITVLWAQRSLFCDSEQVLTSLCNFSTPKICYFHLLVRHLLKSVKVLANNTTKLYLRATFIHKQPAIPSLFSAGFLIYSSTWNLALSSIKHS